MIFTVVTPCRNAEALLLDTVTSVVNQRGLGAEDRIQYIVVDGKSADRTVQIAEQAREVAPANVSIDIVSEPDAGMYDALAKGLGKAEGDVVAYLNAGDYYLPYALSTVGQVVRDLGSDWVTGLRGNVNGSGHMTGVGLPPRFRSTLLDTGFYGDRGRLGFIQQEVTFWSARLNDRIDLRRLGEFRLAGDFYLWHTFARYAPLMTIDSVIGGHRRHPGQLSEDLAGYRSEQDSLTSEPRMRDRLVAAADTVSFYLPEKIRKSLYGNRLICWDTASMRWRAGLKRPASRGSS